ncbi:hypothetical protein BTHERMOSOX_508 [Bathymodiolus thermophilus thioautotrophic gill symbiont]|nr:hypothetical protein BTHERMOSOX_508 [Bathymodiolus thermophilus thioautotrophic gill symbiont]
MAKFNFCPPIKSANQIGDFIKPCPSKVKTGFKKLPSGRIVDFDDYLYYMQRPKI